MIRKTDELYLFFFKQWMSQTHPWFYRIKRTCFALLVMLVTFTIASFWLFPGLWFRMGVASVLLIISHRIYFHWRYREYQKEYAKQ